MGILVSSLTWRRLAMSEEALQVCMIWEERRRCLGGRRRSICGRCHIHGGGGGGTRLTSRCLAICNSNQDGRRAGIWVAWRCLPSHSWQLWVYSLDLLEEEGSDRRCTI